MKDYEELEMQDDDDEDTASTYDKQYHRSCLIGSAIAVIIGATVSTTFVYFYFFF